MFILLKHISKNSKITVGAYFISFFFQSSIYSESRHLSYTGHVTLPQVGEYDKDSQPNGFLLSNVM